MAEAPKVRCAICATAMERKNTLEAAALAGYAVGFYDGLKKDIDHLCAHHLRELDHVVGVAKKACS